MSILDALTGGNSKAATSALKRAEAAFANIKTPGLAELTLPELQKYVAAGILTPEEAKAILIQGNAYNDMNVDPSTIGVQKKVIGQFGDIADKGGMTDQMKARLTQALDQVATNTRGANAGILDQMAQRGISKSLMAPAAMMAENAQESRAANLNATQAAGDAEKRAMDALMSEGNLASSLRGQQYNEAAQKAAAENAIRQWNAGTQTNINEANAGRRADVNAANLNNAQNISNQNVTNANTRTAYNANLPQQMFGNEITKASGQAGVNQAQANQYMSAGNQMMGLIGAGIGAGATAFAPGTAAKKPPTQPGQPMMAAEGGLVPGDSPRNDVVPARLSPGELVVPRSIANDPEMVKRFAMQFARQPKAPVHPDDVHSVLEALTKRRATQTGSTRG